MRFVKFEQDGRETWVNPDQVVSVEPLRMKYVADSVSECRVLLSTGAVLAVPKPVGDVVDLLELGSSATMDLDLFEQPKVRA